MTNRRYRPRMSIRSTRLCVNRKVRTHSKTVVSVIFFLNWSFCPSFANSTRVAVGDAVPIRWISWSTTQSSLSRPVSLPEHRFTTALRGVYTCSLEFWISIYNDVFYSGIEGCLRRENSLLQRQRGVWLSGIQNILVAVVTSISVIIFERRRMYFL